MKLLFLTSAMLIFVLLAPGQGRGRDQSDRDGWERDDQPRGRQAQRHKGNRRIVFRDADRRILREWHRGQRPNDLPPGLARRGSLPPGLQRQLVRNGRLPPGLEGRFSPFPDELNRRLGPLPPDCGCERRFFDGRAMILATGTNTILDVMNLY